MTNRRLWGLGLALAVALTAGYFVAGGMTRGQDCDPQPKVVPGKGKRAMEFIKAFNSGDAKAVASFWTKDADYTDQIGRQY
jgi:hypothetical protein